MSEDIQRLKEIGAQKIHKDTHIALGHIEAIFEEKYESLNRVQFLGFISILEREYHLDLSGLRDSINSYYVDKPLIVGDNQTVFSVSKEQGGIKSIYVIFVILLFLIIAFVSVNYTSEGSIDIVKTDIVEKVKEKLENTIEPLSEKLPLKKISSIDKRDHIVEMQTVQMKVEENQTLLSPSKTDEVNQTIESAEDALVTEVIQPTPKEKIEEKVSPKVFSNMEVKKLIISPRSKVWIGYINLKTRKKSQKVTRKSMTFREDHLIVLGHSFVKFRVDDKKYVYKTKGNLRLLFKDGVLKRISLQEFKRLNRGHKW